MSIVGVGNMPNLIESSEFGLEDEKINKEVAFNLLSEEDQEVFENNDRYVFFKVGDFVSGKLACISKGNNDPYISYYVEYETRKIKNIGSNVTQVLIWRAYGKSKPLYITKDTFFKILLPRWKTIVSDETQTPEGAKFWLDRMSEAYDQSYDVGLYNRNTETITWYDGECGGHIDKWANSTGAWGTDISKMNYRFVITPDKALTKI